MDFNQVVTISAKNVVSTELETDDFPRLREGTTATVGQLVEAMVEQSDNTAYNTLLDVLDRRNINQTLKDLGITQTVVGEKLNLDDDQFSQDLLVPGRQPVTTTAKDLATLFELMYKGTIPDSDQMLTIFKKQKINNMIPALLPESLEVAHKTGDWAPIYHDGGIIYKENAPFVLSVFTNSNDPSVISKLAKVAYAQSPTAVGKGTDRAVGDATGGIGRPTYSLAYDDNLALSVLGSEDIQKVPKITAADLGINAADLNNNFAPGSQIKNALIGPASPFYKIKKTIEDVKLKLAFSDAQKVDANISASENRLAEFKKVAEGGDLTSAKKLLDESEQNLTSSISHSQSNQVKDEDLAKIKQANDAHFETLSKVAANLPDDKKAEFVDMAFEFIKKNEQEVKPIIAKSLIATKSANQEPIIGTVVKVENGKASVKFDDGTTKDVIVDGGSTPSRDFGKTEQDKKLDLAVDSKVAIIGQTTKDGNIAPQFILKNLPKNLPDNRTGTVIEVNPGNSSLKISTPTGVQEVKVDDKTQIKSKDTDVSLEGIKAGSQVSVFGVPTSDQTTGSVSASPTANSLKTPSGPPTTSGSKPTTTGATSVPATTTQPIKANSVTIVKNSSGAKEQKTAPSSGSKPSSPAPAGGSAPKNNTSAPPPQSAPANDGSKKDDKKK